MSRLSTHLRKHPALYSVLTVATMSAAVFAFSNSTEAQAQAGDVPPPVPQVDVVTIAPEPVRVWNNFSGRMAAVDFVEIRPQVSGTITEVLFEDGQTVEQGQPLFVIDERPFEANLATAKAALASAKSEKDLAYAELVRAKKLLENKHISESLVDSRRNDFQVAMAAIDSAKAALETAKLDLQYANITAPVAGRISRAELTEGNLVEAGNNAPVLTTIVSNDSLYAEFDVDEQTYIRSVRRMRDEKMPVELKLSSGDDVTYKGTMHSFDNRLDTTSGTIRARAIFDNTDGALLPGMYAEVRLGSAGKEELVLIPERAIGTDQDKRYVYVVNTEGKVEYREVRLGKTIDGKREVRSGLEQGELVMVNSLQRVRPGMDVKPRDIATRNQNDGANESTGIGELAEKAEPVSNP